MGRLLRDFFLRTVGIIAVGWAAAEQVAPPCPRLASPQLREEAALLLDGNVVRLETEDVRYLPALIDLIESPRGREAAEVLSRVLQRREVTNDRNRPVVDEERLASRSYRRSLREGLVNWFARYGTSLEELWPAFSLERARAKGL